MKWLNTFGRIMVLAIMLPVALVLALILDLSAAIGGPPKRKHGKNSESNN